MNNLFNAFFAAIVAIIAGFTVVKLGMGFEFAVLAGLIAVIVVTVAEWKAGMFTPAE